MRVEVLDGATGPLRDCVILNAGAALYAAERAPSIAAGMEEAERALRARAADELAYSSGG